jgi:hypothetical protein
MYLKNPQKQRDVMTLGPPVFHHSSSFWDHLWICPKCIFWKIFVAQIDSATSFCFFDKKDGLPATTDEWCASFSFFGNPALENVNLQVFTYSPKVSTLD